MIRNITLNLKTSFRNEALITINRFIFFISLITINFSKIYILYYPVIFLILIYHLFLLYSSAHRLKLLLTRSIFIMIFKKIRSIFFFFNFLQFDKFTSTRTSKRQKCVDVFDSIRALFNTIHSIIEINFSIFIKNEQPHRFSVFIISTFLTWIIYCKPRKTSANKKKRKKSLTI